MTNTTFSIGTLVINFGITATVVGYHETAYTHEHTGLLILESPEIGRWIADPGKCERV